MAALTFELQASGIAGSEARAGKIRTDHGEIITPIFMPVGTVGSVKAVTKQQLKDDVQAQIILGNTYHLYLRPGTGRLAETPDKYGYTQNLFPIVQGSTYKDLRDASCDYIASKNAVGNAIGGLSVGEPEDMMYEFTESCASRLPFNKPRYLMGVGTPWNILECIHRGIDLFDCVMPTRNGRNGMLFTTQGVVNIRNKKWATDFSPIDPGLPNEMSQYYTKAYLRHLFVSEELLGLQLASLQNLSFYLWLVGEARKHILGGDFVSWKNEMVQIVKQRL
eukprot:jgi/Mesen1/10623/ME000892S10151